MKVENPYNLKSTSYVMKKQVRSDTGYSKDRTYSQEVQIEKIYKPVFQLALDFIVPIILILIQFFALLGSTFQVANNLEIMQHLLNVNTLFINLVFHWKFFLGFFIYKCQNQGNTKRVTIRIFIFRILYDIFIIGGVITIVVIFQDYGIKNAIHYMVLIAIIEIVVCIFSVKEAHRRVKIKRAADRESLKKPLMK